MTDMLGEHRSTLAWLRAGWPAPSEIEARLNRIEDALLRLEAAPALTRAAPAWPAVLARPLALLPPAPPEAPQPRP